MRRAWRSSTEGLSGVGGAGCGESRRWNRGGLTRSVVHNQEDAEQFYTALGKRLGKFGLELSADKTRVVSFHRHPPSDKSRFEFYWGRDRGANAESPVGSYDNPSNASLPGARRTGIWD